VWEQAIGVGGRFPLEFLRQRFWVELNHEKVAVIAREIALNYTRKLLGCAAMNKTRCEVSIIEDKLRVALGIKALARNEMEDGHKLAPLDLGFEIHALEEECINICVFFDGFA
jgi:hypothetical protein